MSPSHVPCGFEPHFRRSGLTEPWEPLYSKRADGMVVIGLRAGPAHANSRGAVHGGLMSALADNAMGLSCAEKAGEGAALVTVSLSVDFMAPAAIGQWLEFVTGFTQVGGSIAFAHCLVMADGTPCARASATFRILRTAPGADREPRGTEVRTQ